MTKIRKLITAWATTLVVSLLLPLASFAAVPSMTHDLSAMTTTIPATVAEHTTAVTAIEYDGIDLQSMVSGKACFLLGLSGNLVASRTSSSSSVGTSSGDSIFIIDKYAQDVEMLSAWQE